MPDEILSNLATYIATEIMKQPNRTIDPNESLLSSGLIDSFHLVDLSMYIEDQFGVRIDDTELNSSQFDNLSQLTELIRKRMNKQ